MLFPELASPWDSTIQMNLLQERLNRLFASVPDYRRTEFPPINVWASEEKIVVVAEVSGIDPENIDLQIVNRTLTLKTKREPDQIKEGQAWHRQERAYGQFSRSLELPYAVDTETVQAYFSQGILRIQVSRAIVDLPKKISVQAS